jgi:hypothetical protein
MHACCACCVAWHCMAAFPDVVQLLIRTCHRTRTQASARPLRQKHTLQSRSRPPLPPARRAGRRSPRRPRRRGPRRRRRRRSWSRSSASEQGLRGVAVWTQRAHTRSMQHALQHMTPCTWVDACTHGSAPRQAGACMQISHHCFQPGLHSPASPLSIQRTSLAWANHCTPRDSGSSFHPHNHSCFLMRPG